MKTLEVTRKLSAYAVKTSFDALPGAVIHEAKRSLLNILGVAIGAVDHPSVGILCELAKEIEGRNQSAIWGKAERVDMYFASMINGLASHVFDFDDTHLDTLVHPSSPVAPAVIALGEVLDSSGRELLLSFILGVEAACRIARGVMPEHYERGYHLTSTMGPFGAAVACGKLLKLDGDKMAQAIGLAATQSGGLLATLGTMSKAFHPGKAAMNGLLAAKMAEKGFTCSREMIEAPKGFAVTLSPKQDWQKMVGGLGEEYLILENSYKPYACGVVAHPVIDGILRLRERCSLAPREIESVECRVHKYVPRAMGTKEPRTGLEGKFSTYHCVAAALVDGKVGEKQFSDERVLNEDIKALREKVRIQVDPQLQRDEAVVVVKKVNGSAVREHVVHALGSKDNPMRDGDLEDKFREVTGSVLPRKQIERLIDLIWNLEKLIHLDEVINNMIRRNG